MHVCSTSEHPDRSTLAPHVSVHLLPCIPTCTASCTPARIHGYLACVKHMECVWMHVCSTNEHPARRMLAPHTPVHLLPHIPTCTASCTPARIHGYFAAFLYMRIWTIQVSDPSTSLPAWTYQLTNYLIGIIRLSHGPIWTIQVSETYQPPYLHKRTWYVYACISCE